MCRVIDFEGFRLRSDVEFDCGMDVNSEIIIQSVIIANQRLGNLPFELWRAVDLKSTGAIVGAYLSIAIAESVGGMVNPIEKGHPDVIPLVNLETTTEEELRNYPSGIEVKGTCGNVTQGLRLEKGVPRAPHLTGVPWQAHHREVEKLLSTIWDFSSLYSDCQSPTIQAVFYSEDLVEDDWGAVSGTSGRNTKVSGMLKSGKEKLGRGTIGILRNNDLITTYRERIKTIPSEFSYSE